MDSALGGKQVGIAARPTAQYFRDDKTWRDFFPVVRAAALTGLSIVSGAIIAATDTVLGALGKLQKQVTTNLATLTSHVADVANPHGTTKSHVGLSNVDNVSAANLRDRTTHTGTQAISTVASLQRSEEHTSELQSLMRITYAVFCLKKKTT